MSKRLSKSKLEEIRVEDAIIASEEFQKNSMAAKLNWLRAGVIGAQVDAAKAALETKATELEAHRSRLLDTDIAEASAGLVRTQTLLEAARSIFARLEASNLFQRLM